ncbi:Protein of unknown function [Formivibrio citricus]|uniref:DUF721 domain-containing protein n=1 Tax=Formivibrio citricus TaxID=83765 RepID=A0A1I4VK81_9NEIS|nr:DciA family protein [Formivibrio citricus]SFN01631.1 Protein of unknown function [Formivibrio citricus]
MQRRPSRPGFVGRDPGLARIVNRVGELQQVLDLVRHATPPELAPLCQGVAWSGSTVVIGVPHSAAATRLRLAAPAILAALQDAGWHATAILPRVQVNLNHEKPRRTNRLSIPPAAQKAFADLANTLEDKDLQDAIQTLLKHQKQS